MDQVNEVLSKPQIDKKVFDTTSYALPKSDQIVTRLQENLKKFGTTYSQFTIAIVLLGGLTNLVFLACVGGSIAFWYFILKNDDLLLHIPDFGYLTSDKKKVVLFLCKNFLEFSQCSILVHLLWRFHIYLHWDRVLNLEIYSFLISFLHAFLFVSPSTGALIDGQNNQQANQDLSQYVNFSNQNQIELQYK